MSVFYMKHPKHGTKVATEEAEVEFDKKRGWEEYDPIPTQGKSAPEAKAVPRETLSINKEARV